MTEEQSSKESISSRGITRRGFLRLLGRRSKEAAAMATVLWLGCGTRQTMRAREDEEPPTGPATPDQLFNFAEGIPEDQKKLIGETASQVWSWLNSKIETPLEPFTVYAADNAAGLIDRYLERTNFSDAQKAQERQNLLRGATAWAGQQNDLYIITSSAGWTRASPIVGGPVREGQMHTIAHELFHLLQVRSGAQNHLFPAWLWEGSAHYIAAQFLSENDLYPYENIISRHIREATPMPEPLQSLEGWEGFLRAGSQFADEYSLAFLATKYLTKGLPGGGVRELASFWESLGKGIPWPDAFREVFGKTTQEYYSGFEEWRKQGFND